MPIKAMCVALMVMLAASASSAEGDETVSYKEMLTSNQGNLTKLAVGMTKQEVLDTMGTFQSAVRDGPVFNPYQSEVVPKEGHTVEILYYLTMRHPPFMPIMKSQSTPVVLRDGKLVGWGWTYVQKLE